MVLVSCPECKETFINHWRRLAHIEVKHKKVQCPQKNCNKFLVAAALDRHIREIHGKNRRIACPKCGMMITKRNLSIHCKSISCSHKTTGKLNVQNVEKMLFKKNTSKSDMSTTITSTLSTSHNPISEPTVLDSSVADAGQSGSEKMQTLELEIKSSVKPKFQNNTNICIIDLCGSDSDIKTESIENQIVNVEHESRELEPVDTESTILSRAITDKLIKCMCKESYKDLYKEKNASDSFDDEDKEVLLTFLYEHRFLCELANPSLHKLLCQHNFLGRRESVHYTNFVTNLKWDLSGELQRLSSKLNKSTVFDPIYEILRNYFG